MRTYIVENNTGLLRNRNNILDNEEHESRNTASTHLNVREIVPHLWDDQTSIFFYDKELISEYLNTDRNQDMDGERNLA